MLPAPGQCYRAAVPPAARSPSNLPLFHADDHRFYPAHILPGTYTVIIYRWLRRQQRHDWQALPHHAIVPQTGHAVLANAVVNRVKRALSE